LTGPPENSRKDRIIKGFARLASGTMVSRVTGLAREIVLAFFLGSGAIMDAFVVAFTLPNLFRRILGEKVLESAMLPTYKQYINAGDSETANNLVKTTLLIIVAIGSFITAIGMVFTPTLVNLFAPGFDSETHFLAVAMTRVMFPFLVIISVASLFGVILQTREKFGLYGLAPAMFNIVLIVVLWLGIARYGPIIAAIGVLAGGFLEALIMYPIVRETFRFDKARIALKHSSVKKVNRLAVPVCIETVLDKAIVLVDRRLASLVSAGSIAALGYSFRLLQLPYGILVLGIARSCYQHLVDSASNMYDFAVMIGESMRFTLALMTPCAAALVVFAEPFIRVVYQRGAFDEEAVRLSTSAFACYGIGVIGMTVLAILSRAFHALNDTKTPVKVAVIMMIINIVLNYILVRTPLEHAGLALASSIAYSFSGIALVVLIKKKIKHISNDAEISFHLVVPLIKISGASLIAAASTYAYLGFLGETPAFRESLTFLLTGGSLFVAIYIGMMAAFKMPITKILTID
jgi:putative peptidoglycan lipid II flippase